MNLSRPSSNPADPTQRKEMNDPIKMGSTESPFVPDLSTTLRDPFEAVIWQGDRSADPMD